jgi:inorganic pyrophosphatase
MWRATRSAISLGANSFLVAEYKLCALFILIACPCMSILIAWGDGDADGWAWSSGFLSGASFFVGALTSIVCGWIGMKVAVYANARCTVGACDSFHGWTKAFNTAFRAGGVMGFSLTGIALLSLYFLLCVLSGNGRAARPAGTRTCPPLLTTPCSLAMTGRLDSAQQLPCWPRLTQP